MLARNGIHTAQDLLFFFPRTYVLESAQLPDSLRPDQATGRTRVRVTIERVRNLQIGRARRRILEAHGRSPQGHAVVLVWFHVFSGLAERLERQREFDIVGKPTRDGERWKFAHPELYPPLDPPAEGAPVAPVPAVTAEPTQPSESTIVPVYVEIEGVPNRTLRTWMSQVIDGLERDARTAQLSTWMPEFLPLQVLQTHQLMGRREALLALHRPQLDPLVSLEAWLKQCVLAQTPAQKRWIYEEFFRFQYHILRKRLTTRQALAPSWSQEASGVHSDALNLLEQGVIAARTRLGFQLTAGQQAALNAILRDLASGHPMRRLIQGDVGCGKTAVALLASAAVLSRGHQVAIMAPTEILATQHARNAERILGPEFRVLLLTGRTSTKARKEIAALLQSERPVMVIGTHALTEDWVPFCRLSLVILDEQHRFGVDQRRKLMEKGGISELLPHALSMTATPIPRTLALTLYGDLQTTTIRELPPGRQKVDTRVLTESQSELLDRKVREQIEQKHQVYWILPLVEESEAEGFENIRAATTHATELAESRFPTARIGLLHGQLPSEQKQRVLDAFAARELDILVATTVVEVGIDQPNATLIVIENAERFGLSQLHQLRGRVGRGCATSTCLLLTALHPATPAYQRLLILERASDGFAIAEEDLQLRGPGEFLGTRQAGALPFKVGDLVRDQRTLEAAREDVVRILQRDPDLLLPEHQALKAYFQAEARIEAGRLQS